MVSISLAQNQQKDQDGPVIKLSTELVTVDVQVLNKKTGDTVSGLTTKNFEIYEDGVKQTITNFSQDKVPLSVILLLDVSGSVQPNISQIQIGAIEAMKHLKSTDEVALLAFSTYTGVLQNFTTAKENIIKAIGNVAGNSISLGKATRMNEALYRAAEYMHRASNPSYRHAIIVITDDFANNVFGGRSFTEASTVIYESGSVVCGLIIPSGEDKQIAAFIPPDQQNTPYILRRDSESVTLYAKETGGDVLKALNSDADVSKKFTNLIEYLRALYSIGYVSTNSEQNGKFRRIKVKLSPDKGFALKSKHGYYAQKVDLNK